MVIFNIAFFLSSVTALFLGIFVYRKNPRSTLHKSWLFLSTTTSFFCFFYQLHLSAPNHDLAVFYSKLLAIGAIPTSPAFLIFAASIADSMKKARAYIIMSFVGMLFFLWTVFTDLYFTGVKPIAFFEYYAIAGKIFPYYIAYYTLNVLVSYWLVFTRLGKPISNVDRATIVYSIYASLFGFFAGACTFAPMYGLYKISFFSVLMPFYPIIISLAILQNRFMDVGFIIRRTAIFTGLFASVYAMFSFFTFIGQTLFEKSFGWDRWTSMVPTIIVIIAVYRPLERILIKLTDRHLFQKKYDYKRIIREFIGEISAMEPNIKDIADRTLTFLDVTVRPKQSAILIQNAFTKSYEQLASRDYMAMDVPIAQDSKIIEALKDKDKIIRVSGDITSNNELKERLTSIGVELIVPLSARNNLMGILLLGQKKSEEMYIADDFDVLTDLTKSLTIALTNARLFKEMMEGEKRATIGTMAGGIKHEINNPLNAINVSLQSFVELAKLGKYDDKTVKEIIPELRVLTEVCTSNTKRIADIAEKVAEFARPGKRMKVSNVDVSKAINESVSFLAYEKGTQDITVQVDIQCDNPTIEADEGQIKQVLLNLLRNAAQSIGANKGAIRVEVSKSLWPDGIVIKVIDTGCGIDKEDLGKIFTPFFTTKGPEEGQGIGLALVKQVVEVNHGRIDVESEKGKGTTFKLMFRESK